MSAPAPVWRSTLTATGMELRLSARRGENLLVTIVIPAVVLVFFASVGVLATPQPAVDFLLPGSLALAVIATSLVSLGIATAYERHYGVLKRLGGSPLPRAGLIAAKVAAVLVIELVQVVLLVAIAAGVLGWRPPPTVSPALLVVALVVGTATFAGIGLAMAGRLRAEATLALANGLFLVFLLLGGIVIPIDHLPGALEAVARVLPAAPLADVFRVTLGAGGDATGPLAVLLVWAVVAIAVAATTFRWE